MRVHSGADAGQARLRRQAGAEGSGISRDRDSILGKSGAERGVEVQGRKADRYPEIPRGDSGRHDVTVDE